MLIINKSTLEQIIKDILVIFYPFSSWEILFTYTSLLYDHPYLVSHISFVGKSTKHVWRIWLLVSFKRSRVNLHFSSSLKALQIFIERTIQRNKTDLWYVKHCESLTSSSSGYTSYLIYLLSINTFH